MQPTDPTLRAILLATLVLLPVASVARAAGGPVDPLAPAKRVSRLDALADRLARRLDLNADQRQQFDQLRERSREVVQPLFDRMRSLHGEMQTLLDSASPDPAEVGAKAIAMHEVRDQLRSARQELVKKFAALLNDDQRARFDELKQQWQNRRRRDGAWRRLWNGAAVRQPAAEAPAQKPHEGV